MNRKAQSRTVICGVGDRHSAIELLSCIVSAERLELSSTASKTAALPVRRSGIIAKTVAGFEPAMAELQSTAFPLGYTVIYGFR